ncbi:MAG: WG repeat-containing protein [Paludibacteraceae bacterium]|nr:WG repeat-containing protein [Paludibacteraceae bacterium]
MKRIITTLFALSIAFVASAASLTKKQTEELNNKIKDYDYVGEFSENRALVTKDNKSGFINKSGEVVIPLQFENLKKHGKFRNGLWCDESVGVIDSMGNRVVPEGKVIRIDRLPSCYEPTERINECSYFKPVDIIQLETEPGKKVTYCFEYGKLLFTMDNDWPVVNVLTGDVLSITKKGKKEYMGEEQMKKQGFQAIHHRSRISREVRECLVLKKEGKYGVVDMNFNVVCPFIIESTNIIDDYIDGTVLFKECFVDESELGQQVFTLTTTIYRNKKILVDKLYNEVREYGKYLFFDGYSSSSFESFLNERGVQIPESAKQKKLYTLEGKEVNPMVIPVGQNRLRLVVKNDVSSWMFEDAKGNALIKEPLYLKDRHFLGKRIIETESEKSTSEISHICIDVATGDTAWIPENHPIFDYLDAGILKFSDLSKYRTLPLSQYLPLSKYDVTTVQKDNESNVKFMYKEDYENKIYKVKNIETGVEKEFKEVSSFSDELLRVKYNNRWYFLNDKGEGIK